MSLSRLALRIITSRALRGATLADTRVFDSAVDPIDMQVGTGNRDPFLVVYTDDHTRQITGRDLFHGDDSADLVIEAAVAAAVSLEGDDGESVDIPPTDAGMEIILDLLGHQVLTALTGERTAWSSLFNRFVLSVEKVTSRRGASAESGVRFAARQITITCNVVADPIAGDDLSALWSDFLGAVAADPQIDNLELIIRHAITNGGPMTGWRAAGAALGLSDETTGEIGLVSVTDESGDPVGLDEAVLDGMGEELVVDEQALDDAGV